MKILITLLLVLLVGCATQEYVPKQDYIGENLGPPPVPTKVGIPKMAAPMKLLSVNNLVSSFGPNTNKFGVTLIWERNTETNIGGYKTYHGTNSRSYQFVTDAGNKTNQAVSNLVVGQTYWFAATAYNTVGVESEFSPEVNLTIFPPPPPPKVGFVTNIVQWQPLEGGPYVDYTNFVFRMYSNGTYRVFLKTD